ncbi:MAG TPA: sigma-54 dependent transcriptional regulator [Vicinamibacterales bacterium]|nr:sigma-54 dependent transcriptional regulator [Vicinamibacterales bacterium]
MEARACWPGSAAMRPVLDRIARVATSDVRVLLRGESGVGKEVVAREIHRRSPRAAGPFVKVNCAAVPAELLESELFGHERGAFTGAAAVRIGKFEYARDGTLLLDEIGELPARLQVKLLHVLQDQQVIRLGSNRPIDISTRVIAATSRDLDAMIRDEVFRPDLYYRLQVIEIHVPPLRQRREEIPALAAFLLDRYAGLYRRPPVTPSARLLDALIDAPWRGNVRELENILRRFVVLQDEAMIHEELARARAMAAAVQRHTATPALDDDGAKSRPIGASSMDLHAVGRAAALAAETRAITDALTRFRWNRRKAARHLNVSYKTLLNKMKECGVASRGSE